MDALLDRIWEQKYVFLSTFFAVFTFMYIVLQAIDFLPEPPVAEEVGTETSLEQEDIGSEVVSEGLVATSTITTETIVEEIEVIYPELLSIPKLSKTVAVLNPASRTIADLDAALLQGVVRHPDSATLSQEGNVFVLGHSSYLPQVFNKNFQAFNGIQNLEWGDLIELSSDTEVFEYRVEKVYRAKAKDVSVPIAGEDKLLTLATCNSFGDVDDRFIVEAKQVAVRDR